MYVKDKMTEHPYCISKNTSISKALDIMSTNNFHRLPVVENDKLIGLITEGTITSNTPSQATSLSIYELNYLLSKTNVEDIMLKDVKTIKQDALLEEAACLMRKNDIGCLPVVDDNHNVIGIITQNDIFDAFIDLLGYYKQGSRYVIEIDDDHPGILNTIAEHFFDMNANITNLAVYHREDVISVVIIASGVEQDIMVNELEANGLKVKAMKNENGTY